MTKAVNLIRKQDLSHLATKAELARKADKIDLVEIKEAGPEIKFKDNTIFNGTEIVEILSISQLEKIEPDEMCQVNFTSGETPTQLTVNSNNEPVYWSGDDIDSDHGVFVPEANRRYVVIIYSDGESTRCVVQGVDVETGNE